MIFLQMGAERFYQRGLILFSRPLRQLKKKNVLQMGAERFYERGLILFSRPLSL